jgi:hypothetical protein
MGSAKVRNSRTAHYGRLFNKYVLRYIPNRADLKPRPFVRVDKNGAIVERVWIDYDYNLVNAPLADCPPSITQEAATLPGSTLNTPSSGQLDIQAFSQQHTNELPFS